MCRTDNDDARNKGLQGRHVGCLDSKPFCRLFRYENMMKRLTMKRGLVVDEIDFSLDNLSC